MGEPVAPGMIPCSPPDEVPGRQFPLAASLLTSAAPVAHRMLRALLPPCLLLLLLPAGCGGARARPDGGYRVGAMPAPWRQLKVEDNDLGYFIDATGHTMAVNATCEGHQDPPLEVLTRHLLMGFTEQQLRAQSHQPVDGREALRSRYGAKLDGVPVELLLVVLKKDGCVYDFSYIAPPALFERHAADFDRLVSGFHTGASR